ncbi:MAG: cupin domain-containing protein [Xanthomonadales bacterium]|nr:cupin domain-containing protein [Xanthomonadales bacterium]
MLGMAPEQFLREYWQRQPLLIRQGAPHAASWLSPGELMQIARESTCESRLVTGPENDVYQVRYGPFQRDELPPAAGMPWTLLVQDVDKASRSVGQVLDHFRFLPAWRIEDIMVSLAGDGGSVGPHWDHYDVFLIQGAGRRRWMIDQSRHPARDYRPDQELKILRRFTPDQQWDLETGDVLYLPPGVPHHGVALGECMTFSVGMRAPSAGEILADYFEQAAAALPEEHRLADPGRPVPTSVGVIDGQTLQSLAQIITRHASPDHASLGRWFGRFITRGLTPQSEETAAGKVADTRNTTLHRNPWIRFAWFQDKTGCWLYANGEEFPASPDAARMLADHASLELDQLAQIDASDPELVQDMLELGYWSADAYQ